MTGEDTPGKRRKENLTQRRRERRGYAEKLIAERNREDTGREDLGSGGMLGGGGALGVGGVENSRPMLTWI